ncbi:hypothetical protein T8K17_08985 [Thalassobaculum sp. OXR-137]|uniref:hypothetical protein n=1 Tax=Thalassobaculum sp. OXR-137 TaxID=3100173 RepID=UPI002AC9A18F|nr:hypothetical protein [Thalassobaculum sp. OXR-137]WPZ36271.1 hypothetical protein T8K17_08985 [Thalassobaculum sp. OXR-137]
MIRVLASAVLAFGVGSCTPAGVMVAGMAVATAVDTYCRTTTEAGKQAVRDRLSAGVRVVACFPSETDR